MYGSKEKFLTLQLDSISLLLFIFVEIYTIYLNYITHFSILNITNIIIML